MGATKFQDIGLSSVSGMSEWDELVQQSPSGTLYHTSGWLKALAGGMHQDICVSVLTEDSRIRAGAVVSRRRKFGFTVGRKPWATAYNGIVTDEDPEGPYARELVTFMLQTYLHIRLVHAPGFETVFPAVSGSAYITKHTPILDISDTDRLWTSFDRRVRQRVRKAAAAGIEIREDPIFGEFYDLYRLTYSRQGMPMPIEERDVETTLRVASETGSVRCFVAFTSRGDPAAALVVGVDRKRAYFMLAGSHPVHRKTDAVTLLWWETMKKCAETHKALDLVGHGVGSIDRFKRSFSPRLVSHYETSHYSSGIPGAILRRIDILRQGRSFRRAIRGESK